MICLVTDRRRSSGVDLADLVAVAARCGVDLIQIRERDLQARALTTLVRRCVAAVEGTSSKVLVNDRADVAVAAGAHGVHLRSDSVDAAAVRALLPAAVIGRSVHSAREAAEASRLGGLDYVLVGTMFETPSKDPSQVLLPIEELTAASRASAVPVLAIGGITLERAPMIARAGAAGVAAIGLFIPAAGVPLRRHVETVVASLRRVFDTCGAVS